MCQGVLEPRSLPWTIEWLEWPSLLIQEALAQGGWAAGTVHLEGCEQEARAGSGILSLLGGPEGALDTWALSS